MADEKNTETQILEAAEQLFLEQGFTKTTTDQIAKRAGCNQALVHYYYRTKDRLFNQIFEERAKVILKNFLDVRVNADATFEEKLAMKIEAHFDFLKDNNKLPVFLYNEISGNPERIKSIADKIKNIPKNMTEQMERELQEEIEKGNIRPISIMDLLFTVICLNITPFLLQPIMQPALQVEDKEMGMFLENRKKEAVQTILARLKP